MLYTNAFAMQRDTLLCVRDDLRVDIVWDFFDEGQGHLLDRLSL